eukprot:CAMPEP_0185766932 /NCGR_PEP_ID=MMETSP1174-20130828/40277_1 /TAXON_ID=35687 /ORGANISM="Dictyocha speculum, Strain CCMP1381" /LENGTH=105 /DNA_ID=CAMNT_0028450877 /DNA_START=18 /DNA_END=335 /DNA_ORIENTATION=+
MTEQVAAAERRLEGIRLRLGKLEAGGSSDTATDVALENYQKQVLLRLKEIKAKMNEDGGDIEDVKLQRDQALAENEKLAARVKKQEYRIKHLIKCLNEEESKSKS